MSISDLDFDKDELYLLYNAVVYHRNHLAVLTNHECEDVKLLRIYQSQVTRLTYISDQLKGLIL